MLSDAEAGVSDGESDVSEKLEASAEDTVDQVSVSTEGSKI